MLNKIRPFRTYIVSLSILGTCGVSMAIIDRDKTNIHHNDFRKIPEWRQDLWLDYCSNDMLETIIRRNRCVIPKVSENRFTRYIMTNILTEECQRDTHKTNAMEITPGKAVYIHMKYNPQISYLFPKRLCSELNKLIHNDYKFAITHLSERLQDPVKIAISFLDSFSCVYDKELLVKNMTYAPDKPHIAKILIENKIELKQLEGAVLRGIDFNHFMQDHKFIKLVDIDQQHRDMNYFNGSEFVDCNKFYPYGSCKAGGLHFTLDTHEHIKMHSVWLGYYYKRSATIPNVAWVYIEDVTHMKFKSTHINLGKLETVNLDFIA